MMQPPLQLDRDKARAIVTEWLAAEPVMARLVGRSIGHPSGWRVRADLEADGRVWLSIVSPAGAAVAVWHGPRSFVERDEPGPVQ